MLDLDPKLEGIGAIIIGILIYLWTGNAFLKLIGIIFVIWGIYNFYKVYKNKSN